MISISHPGPSFQGAEILGNINCVLLQHGQIDHLECSGVGRGEHHWWSYARLISLSPAFSNHTPPITGLQSRKAEVRHGRDQVIADAALLREEFRRHHGAHQMAGLVRPRAAAAVAIKARDWVCTAGLQLGTEDIRFTIHSPSLAGRGTECAVPQQRS